jgi:acid phosphatase family membrane protein YuiD
MGAQMTTPERAPQALIFNSPFETGVRAVFVLHAMYPRAFDLERLVALDHLVVHTADVGGPNSLHPATSTHATEMLVRRELVHDGLLLMQSKLLVERLADSAGILYRAGPQAAAFTRLLATEYFHELREAAAYLAELLGHTDDEQFDPIGALGHSVSDNRPARIGKLKC